MRLRNLICRLGGFAAIAAIPACTLTQSVLPPDAGSSCSTSITAAEVNTTAVSHVFNSTKPLF